MHYSVILGGALKKEREKERERQQQVPLIVIDKETFLGIWGWVYVGWMFDLPLICRAPQFKSATQTLKGI